MKLLPSTCTSLLLYQYSETTFFSKIKKKHSALQALRWHLVTRLDQIRWCFSFLFLLGITVFEQILSKTKNCLFLLKFGTKRLIRICWIRCLMFTFSVWDCEYFLGKFVPSNKNLVPKVTGIFCISADIHFSCFRMLTDFLSKFGPKNWNCVFKLKLFTYICLFVTSLIVLLAVSVLGCKCPFGHI